MLVEFAVVYGAILIADLTAFIRKFLDQMQEHHASGDPL
ncbi:MAG: hypothetical protein QOE14_2018 [Humisphaera sp.]|nr:hypothetical protein [Humisphaera sp.]